MGLEARFYISCSSPFKALIDRPSNLAGNFEPVIWRATIPSKVQVFGWLLMLNKVNTQDVLQRKHPFVYSSLCSHVCYSSTRPFETSLLSFTCHFCDCSRLFCDERVRLIVTFIACGCLGRFFLLKVGVNIVRVDNSHPKIGNFPSRTSSKKLKLGTAYWFNGSIREPNR